MNADQAADVIAGIPDEVRGRLRDSMERVTRLALTEARQLSSGDATPQQLAREDHPYARRHGRPKRRPDLINRQTGTFHDAWGIVPPDEAADELFAGLENSAPHAEFLWSPHSDYPDGGTILAFGRPIGAAVEDAVRGEFERVVAGALDLEI